MSPPQSLRMNIDSLPHGDEAFSTKRLPLPRLECHTSRDMATTKMGNDVHFWPGRRADKSGRQTGAIVAANGAPGAAGQPGQPTPDGQLTGKGAKAALHEDMAPARRPVGGLKTKKSYSGAVDDAKKDVRNSLALLRADARSRRLTEYETKEDAASGDLQAIKGEWNHFHYIRLQKEEEVKEANSRLSGVSGDVQEDQDKLEDLKPERDELQREALLQETSVENECRKGSMYEHMEVRAKETAVGASKDVDHLHLEVASLARDLQSLEIYLRETRRLRAKAEEALSWMQENYNARSEQRTERLGKRREQRDQVGRELAETRLKMKELKAQWRAEAERAALEEKREADKQLEMEKLAAQRELAEEDMRIKLERLAHTVGLKHRPENEKPPIDSKVVVVQRESRAVVATSSSGDGAEEGWTPEGILNALQAVEERREDVEKQIETLQARESGAWQALPEWRTKLQAARQGWMEMWKSKLEAVQDKSEPPPPPEPSTTDGEAAEGAPSAQLDSAGKAMHATQLKFEGVVKMLAGVSTGLAGLERLVNTSAPEVQPIGVDGSAMPVAVPPRITRKPKPVDDEGDDDTTSDLTGPQAEYEELQGYINLSETLKRCMHMVLGVFADAEMPRDQMMSIVAADAHPSGIRPTKVRQPLGYLDEKEIPGKYTTKEGFAVAGPHINADEDNDVMDDPEQKRKRRGDSAGKQA